MTTIAWDGHILAADTQCSLRDVIVDRVTKVHDLGVFGAVGFAGEVRFLKPFLEWLENGKQEGDDIDFSGVIALVVYDDRVEHFDECRFPEVFERQKKQALGSGWTWALSSMEHGNNAASAVMYACDKDVYSSKPVTSCVLGVPED